jgi:hypothetical protein
MINIKEIMLNCLFFTLTYAGLMNVFMASNSIYRFFVIKEPIVHWGRVLIVLAIGLVLCSVGISFFIKKIKSRK